jgi:hypothetical protein
MKGNCRARVDPCLGEREIRTKGGMDGWTECPGRASGGGVKSDREGVSVGRTNEMTMTFGITRSRLVHRQVVQVHLFSRNDITAPTRSPMLELSDDRGGWVVIARPHRIEAQE